VAALFLEDHFLWTERYDPVAVGLENLAAT